MQFPQFFFSQYIKKQSRVNSLINAFTSSMNMFLFDFWRRELTFSKKIFIKYLSMDVWRKRIVWHREKIMEMLFLAKERTKVIKNDRLRNIHSTLEARLLLIQKQQKERFNEIQTVQPNEALREKTNFKANNFTKFEQNILTLIDLTQNIS